MALFFTTQLRNGELQSNADFKQAGKIMLEFELKFHYLGF